MVCYRPTAQICVSSSPNLILMQNLQAKWPSKAIIQAVRRWFTSHRRTTNKDSYRRPRAMIISSRAAVWLTVTGLFLSVALCHTCYRLLLVFSLWNGFGQSQFTLLSRIGCNSLLVVDSPFVYELNSCTFISGAPPYSVLLQNKENILFKYKHLSVCISFSKHFLHSLWPRV